jgi:hypothetical protein
VSTFAEVLSAADGAAKALAVLGVEYRITVQETPETELTIRSHGFVERPASADVEEDA